MKSEESRYLHTELHLCIIPADSMYIENANRFGHVGPRGGGGGGGGGGQKQPLNFKLCSISNSDEYLRMVQIREGVGSSFFFREGEGGGSKGEA